jgi:hypothetical protein
MSTLLATAANLATDVAAWMSRADLVADIPTMIVLAESKLNRLLRSLEHEVNNPLFMLSGEYVPVPADFLEFKSGYVNGNPKVPLYYIPGDSMPAVLAGNSSQYFTLSGTNFRFAPIPDGSATATINYFAKLPTLSGVGVQYNWLLQQHPDAYLYGVLLEASGKIQDAQMVQGWRDAYTTAIQQIKAADQRKRYGGNSMTVRVA